MPTHRRSGAGTPPNGGTARLRQRRDIGRLATFHRFDPERARARIRPEPQRPARRVAQGADPDRGRWDDQAAGTTGPWDRARPRCGRALSQRMTDRALYTIGYEKARVADFLATLASAGVANLIDVRDRPISRRPGFSKRQLAAAVDASAISTFRRSARRRRGASPVGA